MPGAELRAWLRRRLCHPTAGERCLEAHTGTGDIIARDLSGDLRVSTGTGNIDVINASGRLGVESGTGNIMTSMLTSSEVDAHTGTGDIALRFTQSPRAVRVDAGTGDSRITVPPGETYQVDATTGTGDLRVRLAQDPSASRRMAIHTGTGDIDASTG